MCIFSLKTNYRKKDENYLPTPESRKDWISDELLMEVSLPLSIKSKKHILTKNLNNIGKYSILNLNDHIEEKNKKETKNVKNKKNKRR